MDSSMFEGEKKIRRRLSPFRACWTFLEQKTNLLPSDQTLLQCCYLSFNDQRHGSHIHGVGWAIC